MTITDTAPTDSTSDDEQDLHEERGWLRRLLDKYRNAFDVARASLFWACLSRQKRTLKWLFALLITSTLGLFQIANLTRGMVDNAIVEQTAPLWPYVTHIAFWAVWGLVFGFCAAQMGEKLSYDIEFDLRVWLYTHVQSAELRSLDQLATGQLITRSITDLQLVEQLLRIFPQLLGFLPVLLAFSVFVIIQSPIMGVLAVLSLPVNILILRRFSRRLRALSWAELNERAEVTQAIDEPVRGIRVVKAFGRETQEKRRVESVTGRAYTYAMTRWRLLARYDAVMKIVPLELNAVLLAVGAWLLSEGRLSAGTFLLSFQLSTGLGAIARVFDELSSAWQYLRGAQDRLAEMLALSTRPVTDGRMVPAPTTGLEVTNVDVQLGNQRLLHHLDVCVAPGEMVVVHGTPGSGKSTLAGIASGLLLADEGEARLDGLPLGELDPTDLRRAIRVVSEEPLLLAATLRDNLLLGAWGDIADEQLVEALRTAGAEDVIEQIHGGLDGNVGDRGLTVSGGQRQRISLARALVANPRVLILDDALSAVNPSLEIAIMRRVRESLPNCAVLYITRRQSLRDLADRSVELPAPAPVATDVPSTATTVLEPDDNVPGGATALLPDAPAEGVTAIDELGLAAEGVGSRVDTAGLARIDARLAAMVDAVELDDEHVDVSDEVVYTDELGSFRSIAKIFGGVLAVAAFLMFVVALLQITPDLIFGQINNLVGEQSNTDLDGALLAAGALAVIAVVYGLVSWVARIYAQRFSQGFTLLLRRRVFARLTKLGVNYYDRELPGDVATRVVADLDRILNFASTPAFLLVSGILIAVVALATIVVIAPSTLGILVVMVGAIVLVTAIQFPFAHRAFDWAREELQVVTRRFQEDFTARHEIRHLGAHAIQTQKYVEACWERRRARWWAATVQNLQSQLVIALATIMSALLLWKTGSAVLSLSLSIGSALAVQVLANSARLPLLTIGQFYNQLVDARVSWRRLHLPFDEPVLPLEDPAAGECPPLDGPVRFEDVEFTYPATHRPVLRGATFTMEPGKVTALVGYTGAGKSSIAKVLMRTYDPERGRVTVGGADIRDFRLSSFRARLGIVPQDPFVFRGTVASNIRYGKADATSPEVDAAVRAVGAHDLLSALPGGLSHPVDEEGHNLTAAQRQLIALARAWLAKPDLLVLDEATSLLDADVEDQIIAAIHELGCTTLMITHRENVARQADNVVVIETGVVVDEGPELQVARPGGPYDRLWRVQPEDDAAERDRQLSTGSPSS